MQFRSLSLFTGDTIALRGLITSYFVFLGVLFHKSLSSRFESLGGSEIKRPVGFPINSTVHDFDFIKSVVFLF